MMFLSRHLVVTVVGLGLIGVPVSALRAQQSNTPPAADPHAAAPAGAPGQSADPLNRQLSDKERYKAQSELRKELKGPYKTWLDEEVPYIISDDERKAFLSLANDEEREAFIENFWQRRNPNPDSPENEFREEHYRRIQYANDHYAAGKPGWKTDRGRIYIGRDV
jgi:GWxTD domain-containing protein